MICGVGIDLIEVERIRAELERSGDSFCNRIFTDTEIRYCRNKSNLRVRSRCFAARFSAKEAFFKAIGAGPADGVGWKDVEVSNDELGKPNLCLTNKALEAVERGEITKVHLSISHSDDLATAVVVLEK
jgi:holo-[acyl-carrier protein] synthase